MCVYNERQTDTERNRDKRGREAEKESDGETEMMDVKYGKSELKSRMGKGRGGGDIE